MRLIALFFSIYVMALTAWPCADEASVDSRSVVHSHEHSHEHEDSGEDDMCSPFCSCQCCQVNMQVPVAFFKVDIPPPTIDNHSVYNGVVPDSPRSSLFIPPRV